MSEGIIIEDVIEDVLRIQNFDAKELVRREKLGDLAFDDAIDPAKWLISVFNKLPTEAIREFPITQLQTISEVAKSTFALFDQILNFSLSVSDPQTTRTQHIDALRSAYQPTFDRLFPLISYSVARTVDFASLESRGRAAVQAINDDKDKVLSAIHETSEQAGRILQEVREAAAEQGVSQMAKYFGEEAGDHKIASRRWLVSSVIMSAVVLAYAVFTFFLPNLFGEVDRWQLIQVLVSKALVFLVLVFGLLQCVRNYSSHRHNYVTNKHRQNALLTFTTLAEAGQSIAARDTVLHHAASAIYSPADSGYLKHEERSILPQNLVSFSTKPMAGSVSGSE